MEDRRRHPRHRLWFPVQLDRPNGETGLVAACQDGSASGLLLRTPALVNVGERVSLLFRVLRSQARWMRVEGRVVRVDMEIWVDDEDTCPWPTQLAVELDEPSRKLEFLFELAGSKTRQSGFPRRSETGRPRM